MGLKGAIEFIFGLVCLAVYLFIFLMVFFGTLEQTNSLYHADKIVNILIALSGTVLLFSFINLWLFGVKAFRVSISFFGILFVLMGVAEVATNTYPQF